MFLVAAGQWSQSTLIDSAGAIITCTDILAMATGLRTLPQTLKDHVGVLQDYTFRDTLSFSSTALSTVNLSPPL